MAQEILSGIISGIILFIIFLLFLFIVYWILGKFGVWKWATYRRLKKRYKDMEFSEAQINFCTNAIEKKWRYKDILRFVRYEKEGSKLLYTYLVMEKLKKDEKEVKL